MRSALLWSAALISGPAVAAGAPSADAQAAAAVVTAFHASLASQNRQAVLDTLAPDVAIFEQGYTESSRDVYGGGHLDSDLEFAKTTTYTLGHREAYADGNTAWVISQGRTTGSFADHKVDIDNTETMVLQRRDGQWKIVHIHWSAHPRGSDE
nr:nuclear transport factor 2 family protein [Solimonas marina]